MKRILSLSILLALSLMTFAQEITVRFTGQLNGTVYQQLDSVVVTNTTRGWTETVVYPDTLIVLGSTVNISENEALVVGLGQNVPNPFDCQTRVELTISQNENVRMQLMDVSGKVYAEFNDNLEAGTHNFEISAAKAQTYILNAVAGNRNYSIRMVNVGTGCSNYIRYEGIEQELRAKLTTANEFQIGDQMQYVGYTTAENIVVVSEAVSQSQLVSQYVTLQFSHILRPVVETLDATGIQVFSSATLNGNIISDGGSDITSRGFYYGTASDNLSQHVTSEVGNGEYSANIVNLEGNTTYYYRAYAVNSVGSSVGELKTFTTQCECGGSYKVTDYDGNQYGTVLIGEQCWMAENLKTAHFADGTSISLSSSTSTTHAYLYNPNNDSNNVSTYGYLYNWPAAMRGANSSDTNPSNVQGICPNGWHLPSDAEWTQLTDYVSSQSEYQCDGTAENIAKALASTTGWNSSTTTCAVGNTPSSNNSTGFGALPAGGYNGQWYAFGGNITSFWSATQKYSGYAYSRRLDSNYAYVDRGGFNEGLGFSVRCLRD